MGKPEIAKKLSDLLAQHSGEMNEYYVVYAMVEIRKYLDQLDDVENEYGLLRFYCDWIVHSRKDKHQQHVELLMKTAYELAEAEIKNRAREQHHDTVARLFRMEELRHGLSYFLRRTTPTMAAVQSA